MPNNSPFEIITPQKPSSGNKKGIIVAVIVILFLVISVVIGLILVRQNQNVSEKAAADLCPAAEVCPYSKDKTLLRSCHPNVQSDGSPVESVCNEAGRIEMCGPNLTNYCCPSVGEAWTTDISKCPSTTSLPTPTASPVGIYCTYNKVYKDDTKNVAGGYYLTGNEISTGSSVMVGEKLVFVVKPAPADLTNVNIVITDQLNNGLTFVDSDSTCIYNSSSRIVTCTLKQTSTQAAFRVAVNSNASGSITNTAEMLANSKTTNCETNVKIGTVLLQAQVQSSASPTPSSTSIPTASPTPIKTKTPTPLATATSSTNKTATPSPTSNSNGEDSTPTATATSQIAKVQTSPRPIPETGASLPTILGISFGIIALIGSFILAF